MLQEVFRDIIFSTAKVCNVTTKYFANFNIDFFHIFETTNDSNYPEMKKMLLDLAFPTLEKAARTELEQTGTIKHYKKGDVLLSLGKELEGVFFIMNGFVKVCKDDAPANQFVLFYLHAGHAFGVSLSPEDKPQPSVISIIAAEPTTILLLPFAEKDRLAKKYDSVYKYILKMSVMHYSFYLNLINSIVFEQLDVRIEYFLSRLSKAKNKPVIKINHQEIADGLHASRESVSRLLKKMEEAGKIKLGRGQIEILDISL